MPDWSLSTPMRITSSLTWAETAAVDAMRARAARTVVRFVMTSSHFDLFRSFFV